MQIEIPWDEDSKLRIMNVYAPTRNTKKLTFWRELLETVRNNQNLHPDIIIGDFNMVENPEIDRLNNRRGADPIAARDMLANLTIELNLVDRWRQRHPKKRGYTFCGETQSRLDRIYMKEELYPWCTDWKIEHPGFKTDHSLVSVQITSENMPFIGKGRWAIPVGLLKNKKLKLYTQALAMQLQTKVGQTTTENRREHNPQVALKTFKKEVVNLYKESQHTHQPKLENTIRNLQKELESKVDAPDLHKEEILEHSKLITERIEALEKKKKDSAKLLSTA